MKLTIYRIGVPNAVVNLENGSEVDSKLMGDDLCTLKFNSDQVVDIAIRDYVTVFGKNYYFNRLPEIKKVSGNMYQYTCQCYAFMYDLTKVQLLDSGNSEFDLIGDSEDFIDLIVTNMNRAIGGWSKGTVDATDARLMNFSGNNCMEVLEMLAREFELQYQIDGNEINLTSVGSDTGLTVSYGKGKGLYELTRDTVSNKNIVTRLYALGSDRNLDSDYRSYAKRLMFDYPGDNYVENNVSTYGLIEATKIFEEFYPKRTGTISYVDGSDKLVFRDSAIDFDVNSYLIPGVTAKVHFQTGNLAGLEFEIESYDDGDKEFTIIANTDAYGYELPNDSLKPAVSDTYVLLDISMPESYITTAEADLLAAATAYIGENSVPRVTYRLELDEKFAEDNSLDLVPGDKITVLDTDLGIDSLVQMSRVRRDIIHSYRYSLELTDHLEASVIRRLYADDVEMQRKIKVSDVGDILGARRKWKGTQELLNHIFDPDDYFDMDHIRPLSIETGMLAVGMKSQQFILKDVVIQPNYTGDANKCEISAGFLIHFSIEETNKTWTLTSNSYSSLTYTAVYYIYARCSRSTTDGQVVLDSTQRKVDDGSTYYYFLVGVLHAEDEEAGIRIISLTYGFTRINGKFITTGRIESEDGQNYFDLDNNVIAGKVTFIPGTGGYTNIGDKPAQLADINSGEGTKLTGIEAGAEVNVQSSPTIGIKINYGPWGTPNSGEAIIHGFDTTGAAADIDGFFYYSATKKTIDRTQAGQNWTISTNMTGSGYIVYRTGSEVFAISGQGDFKCAFCKKENGLWYYDDNTAWILFTPADTDVVIGTLVSDTADHIESANVWGYAQEIDVVAESAADRTQTIIDGGIITSGRIELGTVVTNAGINGYGSAGSEIRIWAGDTYANRATAPFRVNQNGAVTAISGAIGGWTLASDAIYTGSKVSSGYSGGAGEITIHSQGSIHAQNFYINVDGSIAAKNITLETAVSGNRKVKIANGEIWNPALDSDTADISINRIGYNDGQTRYRDLYIYDGKGTMMQFFDGSLSQIQFDAQMWIDRVQRHNVNVFIGGETLTVASAPMQISSGTSSQTIYLPASPENGMIFNIIRGSSGALTVDGNGYNIQDMTGSDVASFAFGTYERLTLVYSGGSGKWFMLHYST